MFTSYRFDPLMLFSALALVVAVFSALIPMFLWEGWRLSWPHFAYLITAHAFYFTMLFKADREGRL